jgi:undecaprenyl-diphosphatase
VTVLQIIVLSLVQGITEFLPISSSGHLILVPILADWPDQGRTMDIAVHMGTLGAVVLYFWRDMAAMAGGLWNALKGRRDPGATLFWKVVVGTLPVVAAGLAMKKLLGEDAFRSMAVIGWTMLGWGIVLWVVDRMSMTVKRVEHMPWFDVAIIGLSQILALVPGTSRSGITMTAARLLGYERGEAARFSMLLSIPTILGAGVLAGLDLWQDGDAALTHAALVAAGLSFVSALIAIALLMAWLKRASFTPFVIYRVVLGVALLAVAYGWVSLP